MFAKILTMLIAVCCVLFPHLVAQSIATRSVLDPAPSDSAGGDRIHFLKTGSSDAIVLESDGRFAMVDAGEDTDNPRGFEGLNLSGYEK